MAENPLILKHDLVLPLTKLFDGIDDIRFFNSCLVNKHQRVAFNRDNYYPVDIGAYAKKSGLTITKAYLEVKSIAERFKSTIYEVDIGKGKIWHTSIIYDYITDDSACTMEVQWNKNLIPLISGEMFPGTFFFSDDRMGNTSSKKRYLLGELLQKNLWKLNKEDSFIISYRELRDVTNTTDEEYPEYKFFNLRVIQPTLKDMYSNIGVRLKAKGNKREVVFSRDLELINR